MSEVIIQVRDNGPYRVTGKVKLIDAEGNEFEPKEAFSLCRCGLSSRKPYCDGTHGKEGFEDCTRVQQV
jgi:CDGSH-type Zn-finger protein